MLEAERELAAALRTKSFRLATAERALATPLIDTIDACLAEIARLTEAVRVRDDWMQEECAKNMNLSGHNAVLCSKCKAPGCPKQTHPVEAP